MKICIPLTENKGMDSQVNAHFGSAPFFMFVESKDGSFETIENSNQHHQHGMCQPSDMLIQNKIEVVVCSGMGARAVMKLNEAGIKAFLAPTGNAKEILSLFQTGKLKEITVEGACSGHGCGGH